MTTQDNTTLDNKNTLLIIHHLNRFLIVGLSAIALAFDGCQIPDLFYGVSIIIWLWLPEIEIIETKVTKNTIKQFSIVFLAASMIIAIYMVIGSFVKMSQWLPNYEIWLLLSILLMGVISIFYKTIIWLAINNPVRNIGKEYRNEGALK